MKAQLALVMIVVSIWVFVGCSTDNPLQPVARPDAISSQSASPDPSQGRTLWGIWEIAVNPRTLTAEVSPVRHGAFHANVRKFLEESPCSNCLKVVPPILPKPYGLDVTIAITHPFAGATDLMGFDVRGIIMLQGEYSFPNLGCVTTRIPGDGFALRNPDGYTPIFNAADYTKPGILGYSKGKMVPPIWGDPLDTLNAFKAYYSAGQSEDEGGRRAFFSGDQVTRTYEIQVTPGLPFKFWYAVDASWEPPVGDPPYDVSDFPPSANCPETYRFDFEVLSGELYPAGGSVVVGVDIWDHQGWQGPYTLWVEAPECTNTATVIAEDPLSIDGEKAHWEIPITNELGGLDPSLGAELLVVCANNSDDPFNGPIHGYGRFTIPVGAGPNPIVTSVDPYQGEQGSALDNVEIKGENFVNGCTAHLEKAGETDINGFDIVFINSQDITADLSLAGAALGLWDVVVTNPGGAFGTLQDGFEVIEPSGCNSNLHQDYLGTGDFSGGTHMEAWDSLFVHDTGTLTDGEFLGYISGFAGTVVVTYNIDTLTPVDGHPLGPGWGNPHLGSWPVPYSIDVAEETGRFFIAWNDTEAIVEVWEAAAGKLAGQTDASNDGHVYCLDTDGSGGFWDAYFPNAGFACGIKHFLPDGPQPGTLVEKTEDHIMLPEAWGVPQEVICIPDQTLLVLTGLDRGKIRAYDITSSPPVLADETSGIFSGDLAFGTYPDKSCDMVADWSDPDFAQCRIVVFGNLDSGGVELVKIGTDLTIWEGPVSINSHHYQAIDLNPNTGDIALWPDVDGSPGEYALIEKPAGW